MKITLTKPTRASYTLNRGFRMSEANAIAMGCMTGLKDRLSEQFENPLAIEVDYNARHPENFGTLTAFYLVETHPRSRIGYRFFPRKDPKIIFSIALTGYGGACVNALDCNLYYPETSATVLEEVEKYAKTNGISARAGHFAIA